MSTKITPDLPANDPVADSIEMANSGGGVVEPTAQAGVVTTVPVERPPHREKRYTLLLAPAL
jgi:hypothetical protein